MVINEILLDKKIECAKENVQDILNKYGINIPENYSFSDINIIIGPNGAGKTRFLKAIRELYLFSKNSNIVYGYFPILSDRIQSLNNDELPDVSLVESIASEDVEFGDFFKEIEKYNEKFIAQLLIANSKKQKESQDNVLKQIKSYFLLLTNKKIIINGFDIYIQNSLGQNETFEQALQRLSPGELMLFYMSIYLSIHQSSRYERIIILDEPEAHLHPKVFLEFIRELIKNHHFSKIWIATHSLYLVPEFGFQNIVYMRESSIQRRKSDLYNDLFINLLGDENDKVKTFFSSLFLWQYSTYIAECFTNPTVVDIINSKDEQVQMFLKFISDSKSNRRFRVLDCGGGSGRLGLSLEEAKAFEKNNLIYDIYDINPQYKGEKFKVYTNIQDIKGIKYECVVMMNFLHEVQPKEWIALFKNINELLVDNGCILFVEVNNLIQGEKPNDVGYILLGKSELEILFNVEGELPEIIYNKEQKSIGVLINKKYLLNISDNTISNAIRHLEKRMLDEIKKIHSISNDEDINTKTTRKYAFLCQQYINTIIYKQQKNANIIIKKNKVDMPIIKVQKVNRISLSKKRNYLNYLYDYLKLLYNKEDINIIEQVNDMAYKFKVNGHLSKNEIENCWKKIVDMENGGGNKKVIATLLMELAIMGDEKALNRFNNNGYLKYLPKKLSQIDVWDI